MILPCIRAFRNGAVPFLALVLTSACSGAEPGEGLSPKSYFQLRYAATVSQRLDFTCSGAALATVLTYYWGRKTTEEEVLSIFRSRYPDPAAWKDKIKNGFSFDDIVFAAEAMNFQAAGAEVPLAKLNLLNGPVIVHLDKGKFEHFSVLRKVDEETAYLSDPVLGAVGMPLYTFEKQYTGHVMAIWSKDAALPGNSPLAKVRDGMSVSATLGHLFRQPVMPNVPPN